MEQLELAKEMLNHTMKEKELEEYSKLTDKLDDSLNKMDVDRKHIDKALEELAKTEKRAFSEKWGYYLLNIENEDNLVIENKTENIDEALTNLLHKIALRIGFALEEENREANLPKWRYGVKVLNPETNKWNEHEEGWIYDLRYDARKYRFENVLSLMQGLVDEIQFDGFIKMYSNILNFKFENEVWEYDKNKKEFIIK